MKPPKVSVLMAVYNAENYLRQAIESILGQSFEDFELLINDDGSTDRSVEIIQSYRDSRIRAVQNPINQGEERVRNQCLQRARGEYIAVLDADDIAHRDRLQIQTDFLNRNTGVSLVGSPHVIIDEAGRVVGIERLYSDELVIKWGLLFGNQFGHSTVMYRRKDVLAVGGYDESLPYGTDFDLWVRLTTRGRLVNLLNPLAQYRVHSQNTTQTLGSPAKAAGIYQVVARSIQLLTGETIDLELAKIVSRDFCKPASSPAALQLALDMICASVGRFITSAPLSRHESETIVNLAVNDLFRIVKRNPGSLGVARTKALRCVARYAPHSLLKKRNVGILAEKVLPPRMVTMAKRFLCAGTVPRDMPIQS
jgi:glycosyltransferase involved in cell wall biosynthesis